MSVQSAQLVHGQVVHVRLRPVTHRFVYPVFYVRLNLARLDAMQFTLVRRGPLAAAVDPPPRLRPARRLQPGALDARAAAGT